MLQTMICGSVPHVTRRRPLGATSRAVIPSTSAVKGSQKFRLQTMHELLVAEVCCAREHTTRQYAVSTAQRAAVSRRWQTHPGVSRIMAAQSRRGLCTECRRGVPAPYVQNCHPRSKCAARWPLRVAQMESNTPFRSDGRVGNRPRRYGDGPSLTAAVHCLHTCHLQGGPGLVLTQQCTDDTNANLFHCSCGKFREVQRISFPIGQTGTHAGHARLLCHALQSVLTVLVGDRCIRDGGGHSRRSTTRQVYINARG